MDGRISAPDSELGTLTVHTLAERPDLIGAADALQAKGWPRFMLEDDVAWTGWGELNRRFPSFQFMICAEDDTVIAAGNTIPVVWDRTLAGLPSGFDGALLDGIAGHRSGQLPNALSALGAVVDPTFQGRGVSRLLLLEMRDLASRNGFADLIAPVRPSLKGLYPLIPMENYNRWQHATNEGAPFDPWVRTHWRLGARILQIAPESMVITGSVAEWEEWTRMRFPESGNYVVPGALEPVVIDRENDLGRYVEPSVWMHHVIRK